MGRGLPNTKEPTLEPLWNRTCYLAQRQCCSFPIYTPIIQICQPSCTLSPILPTKKKGHEAGFLQVNGCQGASEASVQACLQYIGGRTSLANYCFRTKSIQKWELLSSQDCQSPPERFKRKKSQNNHQNFYLHLVIKDPKSLGIQSNKVQHTLNRKTLQRMT